MLQRSRPADVPELTDVLSNSISTIASTQFLKDGAIATVPRMSKTWILSA